MKRALSVTEISKMNKKTFDFEGDFFNMLGNPETTGVWFVWGNSGNGKSSFVMQLCKELARFRKVAYNSLEEGVSLSMKENVIRNNMAECSRNFLLIDGESIEDLTARLMKKKSPDVIVIDSFQYSQLNYRSYIKFKEQFKNKLIIFISHADGKSPSGRSAKSVMYDSTLKIWIEGYKAFTKGRFYGPTGEYIIWLEKALKYWGEI